MHSDVNFKVLVPLFARNIAVRFYLAYNIELIKNLLKCAARVDDLKIRTHTWKFKSVYNYE